MKEFSRRKLLKLGGLTLGAIAIPTWLLTTPEAVIAQSPEDSNLRKILSIYEDGIRKNKTETGYFFDSIGNVLLKIEGITAMSVKDEDKKKVINSVYTHNHPQYVNGKTTIMTLSPEDFNFAKMRQLKELRAVSEFRETGIKTLSWARRGKLLYWPDFPVGSINELVKKEFNKLKTGSVQQKAIIASNIVYSELAKDLGFEYGYEEWK